MALPRPGAGRNHSGMLGDLGEELLLLAEEVELLARHAGGFHLDPRRARILREGRERGAGELHSPLLIGHFEAGQHPEPLRVAFVTLDVGGLVLIHHIAHGAGDRGMGEPVPDRLLARVSERRIADVVGEGGGGDGGADVARLRSGGVEILADLHPDRGAERTADRTGFQTVGEPGADVVGLDQREHLGLILQPPERSRKDDPVEIALKRRTVLRDHAGLRTADAVRGQQLFPLHQNGTPI